MPSGVQLVLPPEDLTRFWSQVQVLGPDECWPWTGEFSKAKGQGIFRFRGKPYSAYQVSYWLAWGFHYLPGLCICHHCDNRRCVNPLHLWIGTLQENFLDCTRKGRRRNGSAQSILRFLPELTSDRFKYARRKMKRAQIKRIFALHKKGYTRAAISREIGETPMLVSRIVRGVSYVNFT